MPQPLSGGAFSSEQTTERAPSGLLIECAALALLTKRKHQPTAPKPKVPRLPQVEEVPGHVTAEFP